MLHYLSIGIIQKENRNDGDGVRANPVDYKATSFNIFLLNNKLEKSKGLICRGVFPLTLTAIDLDMATTEALSNTATFALDNYDPIAL